MENFIENPVVPLLKKLQIGLGVILVFLLLTVVIKPLPIIAFSFVVGFFIYGVLNLVRISASRMNNFQKKTFKEMNERLKTSTTESSINKILIEMDSFARYTKALGYDLNPGFEKLKGKCNKKIFNLKRISHGDV